MKKRQSDIWLERINPLHGLSIRQAQSIYDLARKCGSPLLQRIYHEIEAIDPVLATCVERRASALVGMGWTVKTLETDDAYSADIAEAQKAYIASIVEGIDNLEEAIEHLDSAFFRGFAHVLPLFTDDGKCHRLELLNSWNFLRDENGAWLWNPDCLSSGESLHQAEGLITISRARAIDYPALTIYIRHALAERDWGRFLERYGVPPVDVTMSPDATEEQRSLYLEAAEKARDGLPAVWPAGSSVSRSEGSRGQDPFSAFIDHQEKLIVLMATGGTLTSLAQADTGSLAGGAQYDVWREIVARDAQIIGNAINKALIRPLLKAHFPGKPILANFELGVEKQPTPSEIFELATKARASGYLVDKSNLESETGFTLEKEVLPQPENFLQNDSETPEEHFLNAMVNEVCRAKDPDKCRVHGLINDQAQALGYKDLKDIMEQASKVSPETLESLKMGGKTQCPIHHAVAFIQSNTKIKDAQGNEINFNEFVLNHYLKGERRKDNTPEMENLGFLPLAILAIKQDKNPSLKFSRSTTPDYINPPAGTQRVYSLPLGKKDLKAFVYVDSGRVSGWHIPDR